MIALGIRYLTNYSAAYDRTQEKAEWPPHPGRVFMAMAAAHFESGADPAERVALDWLESKAPPTLKASEIDERTTVRAYVPANDDHGGILSRTRQDRVFSRARPREDSVFLIWDAEPDDSVRAALDQVCRKVTRIGHSNSAVQMWVVPRGSEPEPNLVPGSGPKATQLRIPSKGTVELLIRSFNGDAIQEYERLSGELATAKGKEKTRIKTELAAKFGRVRPESRRPVLTSWHSYESVKPGQAAEAVDGPFDSNFLVLTMNDGPALGLEATLGLTSALRNAAMKAAGTGIPEWLSGHQADGSPSTRIHVAFFPLPFVGAPYADGHVLGLGIALPRDLDASQLKLTLGPLFFDAASGEEQTIKLWSQAGGWRWELEREVRERPPIALRRGTWTRESRKWASVTPVVLHHYPKKNRDGHAERILREAFASAGFPEPESIEMRPVSAVEGAGHAMSVPKFNDGGEGLCRYQIHVVAHFRQPVRGPMLVGRGRFRGYGLFRPMPEEAGQ